MGNNTDSKITIVVMDQGTRQGIILNAINIKPGYKQKMKNALTDLFYDITGLDEFEIIEPDDKEKMEL